MRYHLGAWGSLVVAAIASRAPIIAPLQKSFKGRRRKPINLSEPPLSGMLHELGRIFAVGISADIADRIGGRLDGHGILEKCFAFSSWETL